MEVITEETEVRGRKDNGEERLMNGEAAVLLHKIHDLTALQPEALSISFRKKHFVPSIVW